ncbi:hypothetical protein HH310_18685 [Actinoplanes sp. TBRC 11911]|uniref:hypothetical protein n=1 Tax=Actinoplanes sp. TBRC 11911 TaxID=2729386 RepID=UPI00145E98F7|nr:hypothetical protein [Actinoplanes sp. TBRC 11911]NMO53212.1 hypothetical protein [Actinoplanes sp. TBRC 11911]
MNAPGDSALIVVLLAVFVACAAYAAGRIHQRWQAAQDREEAYRDGYENGTSNVFSTAVRMLGPKRSARGAAPVRTAADRGPSAVQNPNAVPNPNAGSGSNGGPGPNAGSGPNAGPSPNPNADPGPDEATPTEPSASLEKPDQAKKYEKSDFSRGVASDAGGALRGGDSDAGGGLRGGGSDALRRLRGGDSGAGRGLPGGGSDAGRELQGGEASGRRAGSPPALGFPAPQPPPPYAITEPSAVGGVFYQRLRDPRTIDGEPPVMGERPTMPHPRTEAGAPNANLDESGEAKRPEVIKIREGDEPVARRRGGHRAKPPEEDTTINQAVATDSEAADTQPGTSSGRHTVPDELVRATTYRLPPDRIFRAKVKESTPLPDEPTTRLPSVPKPRDES